MKQWNPFRGALLGAAAGVVFGLPEHYQRLRAGGDAALESLMQLAGMAIGLAVLVAVVCVVRNALVR